MFSGFLPPIGVEGRFFTGMTTEGRWHGAMEMDLQEGAYLSIIKAAAIGGAMGHWLGRTRLMSIGDIPEIGRLTVAEKMLLVEELWDSIAAEGARVPVPDSHRKELDRRLAEYEKHPGALLTLAELRGRVEGGQ